MNEGKNNIIRHCISVLFILMFCKSGDLTGNSRLSTIDVSSPGRAKSPALYLGIFFEEIEIRK